MTDLWLIDKSAVLRLDASPDAELWLARVNRGLVRVSKVKMLEIGFSARSRRQWRQEMHEPPVGRLPVEKLTPRSEARAVQVQGLLADRGQHRAPSIPDLLIAATAELANLTVLHVDKDFDLIAEVTGQSVERLAGDA